MKLILLVLALQELAPAQLVTERGGHDIFPPAFQGRWAPDRDACADKRAFSIAANRFSAYEWDAALLKSSGLIHQIAPDGRPAYTTLNLVAQSGEGEVGIARLRITRAGESLYVSNPEAVSEEAHWTHPNLPCAG